MATRTKTWGDFKRWCDSRKLKALPAHPWTIAAYLRWIERRKDVETAREVLNVISREHLLKSARVPSRHPTVERTMELLERRASTRAQHSNLFDEDILADPPRSEPPPDDFEGDDAKPKRRLMTSEPKLKRRRPT